MTILTSDFPLQETTRFGGIDCVSPNLINARPNYEAARGYGWCMFEFESVVGSQRRNTGKGAQVGRNFRINGCFLPFYPRQCYPFDG